MKLEFSRAADEDLIGIYVYGATNFGMDQAERYHLSLSKALETLRTNPRLARERSEFTPPVRVHFHRHHVILYLAEQERLFIVRILGERQDRQRIIDET
jgi:toxin ParE1/3/4